MEEMKFYDFSHPLNERIPVYPGRESPRFMPAGSIQENGFRETLLNFESHIGTHIDAPSHMLENGKSLDQLPLDTFTGKSIIINVPKTCSEINKSLILSYKERLKKVDFVLFKTGWSHYWGSPLYFEGFPTLTRDAVDRLISFTLKGIGFDTISADPADDDMYYNHLAAFNKGIIIIENLIFPNNLTVSEGEFFCFPLPFENADGSPVRAIFKA